jgi:ribosomal protein L16 Arg81 hydroxylase
VTFADAVASIGVDEFLGRIWGQTFAFLPGARGRFETLLPWPALNDMLQKHRLEPPRLRLVRNGSFAPKTSYLRYESKVPFVLPEGLSQHLRDGYTLIIDAVDDMSDGVMRAAEDFERALHESVQVNLYAGWREQQGFHRHCDTHDVIVLQVYGKKYWRVYEGGRPHPLKDDIETNSVAPDKIAWEGMLESGDALYIPRGWWHEASGVGEVTLHLTFGIHQRTGVSLMHWMSDQLRASTEFRAPLRRFASPDAQAEQLADLRRRFLALLDDDVLARYFGQQNARARTRGWASLPWTVTDEAPPETTRFALAVPRTLNLVRDDGAVHFDANGKNWRFDAKTEPLLRTLERGPATLTELCRAAAGALDDGAVQHFLMDLARNGLVNLSDERSTS